MPQLPFSTALTANQKGYNPIAGWQFEFVPFPGNILLMVRATGTSVVMTVYSGSETIMERAAVQAGGTAGTTPSELNTAPVTWIAAAQDRLKLSIDETGGLTPTVDGLIIYNPLF
jgi:hypothetical protein